MVYNFSERMTLEQYNATRTRMGMEPVDKLPETVNTEVTDNETPVVTNVVPDNVSPVIVDKVITTEKHVEPIATPVAEVKKPVQELSTEEIMEMLKKRGVVIPDSKAVEETPEQKATKREQAKMAWAYGNGHITAKDHAAYNADSSNLENLVYRQFLSDQKALDPSLSDAEIMDEFETTYGRKADPNSRQFKTGEKLIEVQGNAILKDKYKSVFDLEENFSKHEASENSRLEKENKIKANAPKYKEAIEDIFSKDLASYSVKVGEDNYTLAFPQDQLDDVKSQLLDPSTALGHIENGTSRDTLVLQAEMQLLKTSLSHLMDSGMKQYLDKHRKGTKGVVTEVNIVPGENKPPATEGHKAAFARLQPAIQDN